MKIAFVGHVCAADKMVSKSAPVSDLTTAFGFIDLSLSTRQRLLEQVFHNFQMPYKAMSLRLLESDFLE